MGAAREPGLGPVVFVLGIGALAALAACSSAPPGDAFYTGGRRAEPKDEGQAGTQTANGLPCEVRAVLEEKCQTCHASSPAYGASTALVTWDDLQKPGPGAFADKKVFELLKDRIHDDVKPMPPSPKPRLEETERSALDAWLDDGAKPTDELCRTRGQRGGVKPLSCKADTVLKPKKPFELKRGAPLDQYVCYGVDYETAVKKHIVGLAPKIDNEKIVHHVLLFESDEAVSGEPFLCPAAGLAPWKLVAGWNPGGDNIELPPEAGFPAEKGTTHWVLQIHYNSGAEQTGTDQSGYELCTTEDLRKHDAGIAAFGSISFTIPPRASHTIRCDVALGAEWNGVRFFNASPHMHDLGTAMSSERIPKAGGAPERFFEEKKFSFDAQANYPISVGVSGGDVIRTRCSWNNPSDAMVGYGESSMSEMCFDFIGYYPRIPSMAWVTPSVVPICVAE